VDAVSDDPEGLEVLNECRDQWSRFDEPIRSRIHLITLPMDDPEENAAMVNAIQRASTVIVQKSLAEGFGLTVTEGMWKGRPVIASRIGGIQDQITDGVTGFLVDPSDHARAGEAIVALIEDPALADRIGAAAYERVREHYLGARHLGQYLDLFVRVGATAAV
jgi:trehalose synthase